MADINVYGTLRTMATDGIVATADQLKDTNVGKFQEVINQELAGGMEGKQDTIADLEQIRSLANSAVQPSVLQAAIADFITKSVDDLVNYYKKSETYTKAEVNGLIGAVKQFTYRVASSLPTASESTMYIIYLIPSSNASTQNVKDEFITIQNGSSYSWEQIGSTKTDLSDYSTTEEMNAAITSALNTALSDYYDKAGVDELLSNYAHKDGFYETLGAGTALNLQGNTSKDATFTYRTAGGSEDIASGLATIKSIKGNTVVWNQLVASEDSSLDYTFKSDANYSISIGSIHSPIQVFASHKYYIQGNYNAELGDDDRVAVQLLGGKTVTIMTNYGSSTIRYENGIAKRIVLVDTTQTLRYITVNNYGFKRGFNVGDTISYSNFFIIDLTLMFGAGNEPSTVEEFEEWLTNNVGLQDYYEYSAPTMLSADANSLETVGFNLWDEEWERGYYDSNGVAKIGAGNHTKNVNPIKVIPNQTYYFKNPTALLVFIYDEDMNLVQGTINVANNTLVMPPNGHYINFYIYNKTSYTKGTLNINLSWSGIRNGEYEGYWKRTYPINVKQLTSNGTVIFPNGMNRVENVYDEIVSVDGVTKAIKRIGSVDLGTLDWRYGETQKYFYANAKNIGMKSSMGKIICNKYISSYVINWIGVGGDKTVNSGWYATSYPVNIKDSSYTDAATFKAAMNGVMLYYELVTPIEYEIDNFKMPLAYKVDDFGTEETKKDTFSLSPTFAITYGVNAVDTLRRLPTNYISKESMQNFLSALGVQMGGTWTMTLDNNEYKFSFVANPEATTNDEGV